MSKTELRVLQAVGFAVIGLFLAVSKVSLSILFFIISGMIIASLITYKGNIPEHRNSASTVKRQTNRNRREISNKKEVSATPRKVLVMLQNDLDQALRLYEGVASRYPDKSSDWIWDKVASDLERDRRIY